uniref:ZP domain-containing protein n=1 Tax=Pyxicephalus adspersus TaxID=30357 RepID=A0AAV2ZRF3_PYXAD|nr:TPA: hypothetical protein GDO54_003829 [Pyxicephalus adspersus]
MKVFQIFGSNSIRLSVDAVFCRDNCAPDCSFGITPPDVTPDLAIPVTGSSYTASVSCGNDICADDEYCDSSGTACQCNSAIYTYTGNRPSPTVHCSGGILNIFVPKCWLEKNGYNTSNIRLRSADCLATRKIVNNTAQMTFHRPLAIDDCNNIVDMNYTHIMNLNTLYIFANVFPIQTRKDFSLNVSCAYSLRMSVQLIITLKPVTSITSVYSPETNANFQVIMTAFTDNAFSVPISDDVQLHLGDNIYISVFIPDLNSNFKLKVERIYASPGESDNPQYNLLVAGCPEVNFLTSHSNEDGTESRFSMKVFQITGFNSVKLSAEVAICTDNCVPKCNTSTNNNILDIQNHLVPMIDCSGGKLDVFMSKSWLETNGYNTSTISLQCPNCLANTEIVNDTEQMTFHRPLTNSDFVELNMTHVTYWNTLSVLARTIPLQIQEDFSMNVSCSYPLRLNVQLNTTLHPILGTTMINSPGKNYIVHMAVYKDISFSTLLPGNESIYSDNAVYVSVVIPDLDVDTFKIKVVRIYTSPGESDTPQYDLLFNGCPANNLTADTVNVMMNGISKESRFILNVFQISNLIHIKLSADVVLCTDDCISNCSSQTQPTDHQSNETTISVFLHISKYLLLSFHHVLNSKFL